MDVVYSSSDAYSACTGVSLYSLYLHNKDVDILNVYVLSTDISEDNKKRLKETARTFGRELTIIEAREDFVKGAKKLHLPLLRGAYNTYARVMLNTWFSHLDKIFVVDSDTMISGSLSPAWNMDISDYMLAAVPEMAMYNPYNHQEDPELLASIEMYYNMGICIINLKRWREKSIDNLIYERVQQEEKGFKIADQSIINKYIGHEIVRLPLNYNYYTPVHNVSYKTVCRVFNLKKVFSEEEFNKAKEEPAIIHYFGQSYERPWFKHSVAYREKEYHRLRAKTEWAQVPLSKWRLRGSWVIKIYDVICYLILLCGAYETCLKFRYIWGQRLKAKIE